MSCSAWRWYFTYNRVLHLKNTLCTLSKGLGISCNACFYLQYLARCLNYGALLDLPSCKSESWRRYTCTNVLLVCEGEIEELVQPGSMWGLPWGLLCGTSVRKELCMVPCHSRHIYEIWTSRSKKVWGMLKSHLLGVAIKSQNLGSLCNTAVLWNLIASLTGYIL